MKNLLLLLAMLITTSTVFAQLFVRPNPTTSTDSYIYVDDAVIFVEQDVNLEENTNDVNTEASIYLRNDGQLIQGATASSNSGTGSLSVYQTIDSTSNYHYTYWHSPVGIPSGGAGNTNAGVSRLFDADNITRSTLVNTTTAQNGDATTDPITVSTRWVYTRQSSAQNEIEALYTHIGGTNGIGPEEGFIMKGVGTDPGPSSFNSQLYDFRGRPYNGNINVTVNSGDQWTLAGNPYASAMDLKEFFWDNDDENGLNAILYWDEPKDSEFHHDYNTHTGGYGIWIPGPNPGDDDPGSYTAAPFQAYDASNLYGGIIDYGDDSYNRRYAPIGQGFVLQTSTVSGDNIEFKNSHRVFRKIGDVSDMRIMEDSNDSRTVGDENNVVETLIPQIRMHINYINGPGRELLLMFHENSTDGYDIGLDAPLPINPDGTDAYFPIMTDNGMEPFAIQTLPFDMSKKIPLNFLLNNQYSTSVIAVEVLNFNRAVYLWDSLNDTYRDVSTEHPNEIAHYITLPNGHYQERFYLVFKDGRQMLEDSKGTEAMDLARNSVDFFQNNPYKQMEVSNPDRYDIKNAAVYDMTGKLVVSKSNVGTASNFNISTANLADGVYLVKLTTTENIIIDYKTIVYNN